MSETFAYPGRELEAMAQAVNYHRWILDFFEPYLGEHLVEVGAGLGAISEMILSEHRCQTLALVEPSERMYQSLSDRVRQLNTQTSVAAWLGTFPSVVNSIAAHQVPDSVIYINVLEHIEDDEEELRSVHKNLAQGGRVLIFVPALSWLYGSFDKRVGHYRRYQKTELDDKLKRAGFTVLRLIYFDMPGVIPWWIKYRLLRSEAMETGVVRFYDRFIVPTLRRLETRVPPPFGKNIIAIAEKRPAV